jgi:anionic cell wall polymer biosynthesis LytR-Cps2A-Psr (LCP) family protein
MDTLSQLFGVDVDYYAKVNFTTLRDMVNALGGVDLDSIYEFTTISG